MNKRAENFILNEKAFQLGFLPSEQSHPLTVTLEQDFCRSTVSGVATLQRPDRMVLDKCRAVFASSQYRKLVAAVKTRMESGCGNIVFSGCGATGRLAILLEAMLRKAGVTNAKSIMTGGDYALIKAVEFFEDYAAFGARQTEETGVNTGDVFIAITEGGETSSVLGSLTRAAELGAETFLLFNNPADILCKHLERSRLAIENPLVTVLDLSCGPMAVAGSTRMQATTCELLVAGAALEEAAGNANLDFAPDFAKLLDAMESNALRNKIASYIDKETDLYRRNGLITYYACEYMLDLFTDTTERAPTFMLPPFRPANDRVSPPSWAFVRHLFAGNTLEAWHDILRRDLNCLGWRLDDYAAMNAEQALNKGVPKIDDEALLQFPVAGELDPARVKTRPNLAVLFTVDSASEEQRKRFREIVCGFEESIAIDLAEIHFPASRFQLFEHLAAKLFWNTVSTGTMVKMGRVAGNWMSFVAATNKKLIDRAIRLVSELGSRSYAEAADAVFNAMDELENHPADRPKPSCVQYALKQIKGSK